VGDAALIERCGVLLWLCMLRIIVGEGVPSTRIGLFATHTPCLPARGSRSERECSESWIRDSAVLILPRLALAAACARTLLCVNLCG